MATRKKKEVPQEVKNEVDLMLRNGLSEAIMGFNPQSLGVQLSQADTLFKNERWYLISNMRQLLSQMYVEHGIIQTLVDVPVDDGLRGGIIIQSKQLGDEDIEKLSAFIDREDDINTVGQALKWNRLFGGAGVMIITGQEPETPLDMNDLELLEFRAVDMWELFYDKQNVQGFNPAVQEHGFEFYSYYGVKTHKSRVMKMKGLTAPSFIRPRLRGWGFSVVEPVVRSLNQYLKANDLIFEVLDEFKLDIFKIKNLTNTLLSPQGATKIRERVQLANYQKNYQNALTMDSEDDFMTKELTFAGIAETMDGIRKQLASDLRMPLSKLFGISSAGFSSGEDDIENYNAMVESQVRAKSKYDLLRIVELRCQQLFGVIPDDLTISFKPLRMLSSEQEENVKTQKFARVQQARQSGEISSKDFLDACNRENLLPIQIDSSGASIDPAEGVEGANKDDKFGGVKLKEPKQMPPEAKEPK